MLSLKKTFFIGTTTFFSTVGKWKLFFQGSCMLLMGLLRTAGFCLARACDLQLKAMADIFSLPEMGS